jgi:hypothetical protein
MNGEILNISAQPTLKWSSVRNIVLIGITIVVHITVEAFQTAVDKINFFKKLLMNITC